MNWGDLVSAVQTDLGDTTGAKYTASRLYGAMRSAVNDVSMYYPLRYDHMTLEVFKDPVTKLVSDPKKFVLPDDFIQEITVECPVNTFLSLRRDRPGFRRTPPQRPMQYYVDGVCLYLDADPNGAVALDGTSNIQVLLTYYGIHGMPDDADDTDFDLTVSARDLELVVIYIKAEMLESDRSKQSSLDRFKLGTGERTDNPIRPEVTDYWAEYHLKIAERSGKTVFLERPRRYRGSRDFEGLR
jgi:hypothetical protein